MILKLDFIKLLKRQLSIFTRSPLLFRKVEEIHVLGKELHRLNDVNVWIFMTNEINDCSVGLELSCLKKLTHLSFGGENSVFDSSRVDINLADKFLMYKVKGWCTDFFKETSPPLLSLDTIKSVDFWYLEDEDVSVIVYHVIHKEISLGTLRIVSKDGFLQ